MRRAIIRVDASATMGVGHVMRCLTLAVGLREYAYDVEFICREHIGHLCDLISTQGFAVTRLAADKHQLEELSTDPRGRWLGADWSVDAEQTRIAIVARKGKPAWLIVDNYGVDDRWESRLRTSVERIMVVDDLADRTHDCDVLLDQNMVPDMERRYRELVPDRCVTLLGPAYSLLQSAYTQLHSKVVPRSGAIRRILVFFGGADTSDLTGLALQAIAKLGRPDIGVDVVVAGSREHAAKVSAHAAIHTNIRVHSQLPTLAHLIESADLAIGAGGSSNWERLCLGLPALVITLAENQRPLAEGLDAARLIKWLGHKDSVDLDALTEVLASLVATGLDVAWSQRCIETVDGRGTLRVCATLTLTRDDHLVAREANADDERLLLSWANDPATRLNAFSPAAIDERTHHEWFRRRLDPSSSCRIFIVETSKGAPIGQVRFEQSSDTWTIHYSIGVEFRGRGCGRALLETALQKLRQDHSGTKVVGQVKASNVASRKVFESLAFEIKQLDENVVEFSRAL